MGKGREWEVGGEGDLATPWLTVVAAVLKAMRVPAPITAVWVEPTGR